MGKINTIVLIVKVVKGPDSQSTYGLDFCEDAVFEPVLVPGVGWWPLAHVEPLVLQTAHVNRLS